MRALAIVAALLAACGGGGAGDDAPAIDAEVIADAVVTSMAIDAAGGTITTPDGVVLTIPPGALATSTTITITRIAPSADGTVGPVFELGPDGTELAEPATLTLPYDAALVGDTPLEELMVATGGAGSWSGQGYAVIDAAGATASAYITHFSEWAIIPSLGAQCSVVYECADLCCGGGIPDLCCSGNHSACWCSSYGTFPSFIGCYATCVGAPITTNFANNPCMSSCCVSRGGTTNQGACMIDSADDAWAVLTCGRTCAGPETPASLCETGDLTFDACTWDVQMDPLGGSCVGLSGGLNSQFLHSAGQVILQQVLGDPEMIEVVSGNYDDTSLSATIACAPSSGGTGSGTINATWTGTRFMGTWSFNGGTGDIGIIPTWTGIPGGVAP